MYIETYYLKFSRLGTSLAVLLHEVPDQGVTYKCTCVGRWDSPLVFWDWLQKINFHVHTQHRGIIQRKMGGGIVVGRAKQQSPPPPSKELL